MNAIDLQQQCAGIAHVRMALAAVFARAQAVRIHNNHGLAAAAHVRASLDLRAAWRHDLAAHLMGLLSRNARAVGVVDE